MLQLGLLNLTDLVKRTMLVLARPASSLCFFFLFSLVLGAVQHFLLR
jgi:hypothetical protein